MSVGNKFGNGLKARATFLQSFFEYRAVYSIPVFDVTEIDATLTPAAYAAFKPWNISLENVVHKGEPDSASGIRTTMTLLGGRFTLNLGPGQASVGVSNPDWSEAPLILKMVEAGTRALLKTGKVQIEKQKALIAMHLQVEGQLTRDITKKVVQIAGLDEATTATATYGFSIYNQGAVWVVDASAIYPDALFIRVYKEFGPHVPMDEIAKTLRGEENRVLDLLGFQGE